MATRLATRAPPITWEGPSRPRRLGLVLTIALPALALGVLAWRHRWTADDGFIHFRVVEQLLHGNGPVFNPGERVEASTSPAWVGVLALAKLALPVRLEYLALWLSLLASVFGLVASGLGAVPLATGAEPTWASRPNRLLVPCGTLIVVALPPFWDYATSGLEMGLTFGWLGACFWATVAYARASARVQSRRRWWVAVLVGVGPLIRPDLGVFSVCFLLALLVVSDRRGWRSRLAMVGAAVAIPAAYELFRMGYYAALVPNTAIAKSAGTAEWRRGVHYVGNFVRPYWLAVPLALLAVVLATLGLRLVRDNERRLLAVAAAPIVGSALHALYVVRVGGDYMHARMLLPALFAFTMPVAVVAVRTRTATVVTSLVAVWALVCAVALRAPGDDRRLAVDSVHKAHPVTLEDFRNHPWLVYTRQAKVDLRRYGRVLLIPNGSTSRVLPLLASVDARGALAAGAIGMESYAAGTDLFIVDEFGLADPVGSRFSGQPLTEKGHDKHMSTPWVEARVTQPGSDHDFYVAYPAAAARRAMSCGDLARLLHDVQAPLTFGRFLGNVVDSPRLTRLTVPSDPLKATTRFCGR
ncbi:MAG TPA: hypothetical protein VIB48_14525 [Acidimicrobiia bacterium]